MGPQQHCAPERLDIVPITTDHKWRQRVLQQRHNRRSARSDRVAVADPLRAIRIGYAHDRRFLAFKALDRVCAANLWLEVHHEDLNVRYASHIVSKATSSAIA